MVTGACFAEIGIDTTCIDIDTEKIENLKKGISPIYEPGLSEMMERNAERNRLHFSTDLIPFLAGSEVVFIAVGTPPDEDGSADLKHVLDVARTIGKHMSKHLLVVIKSTVPVGTAQKVRDAIEQEQKHRNTTIEFDIVSNPEFLKEGDAIEDFMKPDRIVIGVENERSQEIMARLYRPFVLNGYPILFMDVPSSEMTKYAANSMLATRISFMNDVANLCELLGADVSMVRKGIGSDSRIGNKFLMPGIGYGGSCFPKDVQALIKTAEQHHYEMKVLKAVEEVNQFQKNRLFTKFHKHFDGHAKGKTVAIWGLAFKPQTDDVREAPALVLIKELQKAGCHVKVYDPVAMPETRKRIGNTVEYCENIYKAAQSADCIMLVTEWTEFRSPDWRKLKSLLKQPIVFDGRNVYDYNEMQTNGFTYYGIGV